MSGVPVLCDKNRWQGIRAEAAANPRMAIDSPNALDYKALTGRLAKQQPITPGYAACWRVDRMGDNGSMTQGVLFALAMAAFAVAIVYGLAVIR